MPMMLNIIHMLSLQYTQGTKHINSVFVFGVSIIQCLKVSATCLMRIGKLLNVNKLYLICYPDNFYLHFLNINVGRPNKIKWSIGKQYGIGKYKHQHMNVMLVKEWFMMSDSLITKLAHRPIKVFYQTIHKYCVH